MNENLVLELRAVLNSEGLHIYCNRCIKGSDELVVKLVKDYLKECLIREDLLKLVSE